MMIIKRNIFLVLGEGLIQGLYGLTTTSEAKHAINFTQSWKKIVLSLYNGSNSFLLANTTKFYKSKQIFWNKPYVLCLSNISKDFTIGNIKKTRLKKSCKSFFLLIKMLLTLTIF